MLSGVNHTKWIRSPRQVIRIAGFDRQNQRDKIAEDKSSGLGFPRLYDLGQDRRSLS